MKTVPEPPWIWLSYFHVEGPLASPERGDQLREDALLNTPTCCCSLTEPGYAVWKQGAVLSHTKQPALAVPEYNRTSAIVREVFLTPESSENPRSPHPLVDVQEMLTLSCREDTGFM